jgi:hypothetical protein
MDVRDETFDAKMTVLIENVEHHIEEEEKEMFPQAQQKLGSQLDALGKEMMQRKEALMKRATSTTRSRSTSASRSRSGGSTRSRSGSKTASRSR